MENYLKDFIERQLTTCFKLYQFSLGKLVKGYMSLKVLVSIWSVVNNLKFYLFWYLLKMHANKKMYDLSY